MIYILIGIAYVLLLTFMVRFFQAVHRWDDEISSIDMRGKIPTEKAAKAKVA
jgi:hypothetical protein